MTMETESAWVARAKERTFKHLREEVELTEFAARINDDRSPSLPPDRDEIRAFEVMESAILSGELMRHAVLGPRDDVAGPAPFVGPDECESSAVQMSGGLRSGSEAPVELMRGGPEHAVRVRVREEMRRRRRGVRPASDPDRVKRELQ